MDDLLKAISDDLSIVQYSGESLSDFGYRVCYSALALSLLYSAKSSESGRLGISKKAQTDSLQQLLTEYARHMNINTARFIRDSNNFILHFRKVYEETGYFLTDDRGYEVIAQYGRTVSLECGHLYFGIPEKLAFLRGLGVFSAIPGNEVDLFNVIFRDRLGVDEYIASAFNPLDFETREIDQRCLEFFNPFLKKPPSSSWGNEIRSKRTLARNKDTKSIYRIICENDGTLLYADEVFTGDKESLSSHDTRRLYIALKEQYGEPAVAWFSQIDDAYYEVRLSANLPTREYYFLLLCAWPKRDVFDRISFIATSDALPSIEMVLQNIGIKTIRRDNRANFKRRT